MGRPNTNPGDGEAGRTTRPALDILDKDQERLLYDGDPDRVPPFRALVDGFETFYGILIWYQAAGIRTLGHVERVLDPPAIMPESTLIPYLTVGNEEEGPYVRQRLVETLDSACDAAFRQFRERALEDIDPENTPDQEEIPLRRPAFKKLDQAQADALLTLAAGFESRRDLSRWSHSLSAATNGNKPPHLLNDIVSSPALLEALLDRETDGGMLTRYRFAVSILLPSFLEGARTLTGGELTHDENPERSQGYDS